MIIWLASYTKSGNTLLRSILGSYFFSKDGDFKFEHLYKIGQFPSFKFFKDLDIDIKDEKKIFKNYINAQKNINERSKGINFLKTHAALAKLEDCDFTDKDNTIGAIYIEDLSVVSSFAHHYQLSLDDAIKAMKHEDPSARNKNLPTTFISSWNGNYNSWKNWVQIINDKI